MLKKVINTITNEIYPSVSHLSKVLMMSQGYLTDMLSGRRKNKTIYKYL